MLIPMDMIKQNDIGDCRKHPRGYPFRIFLTWDRTGVDERVKQHTMALETRHISRSRLRMALPELAVTPVGHWVIFNGVRYFLTRRHPEAARIVIVESGPRDIVEGVVPGLRSTYGDEVPIDLITCYPGLPRGFDPATTRVYRVTDYRTRPARARLYRELAANGYTIAGIVCAAVPIMTKWKWMLALRLPAKVFVLNENGDTFWLDYTHLGVIRHFMLFRAGLAGAGAVRTLARVFLFPFTVLYLLLYAATVHSRRALRGGHS
jgi:hypothetical protein